MPSTITVRSTLIGTSPQSGRFVHFWRWFSVRQPSGIILLEDGDPGPLCGWWDGPTKAFSSRLLFGSAELSFCPLQTRTPRRHFAQAGLWHSRVVLLPACWLHTGAPKVWAGASRALLHCCQVPSKVGYLRDCWFLTAGQIKGLSETFALWPLPSGCSCLVYVKG